MRSRDEISNIKASLTANESNIQSLSLIYTKKHPKIIQANDLNDNLKTQLKDILDENIQQKAFELSNLDNFIKLSEDELQKATDELRIVEEKEAGMLKFSREVESSRKLYESFYRELKKLMSSKFTSFKIKSYRNTKFTNLSFLSKTIKKFYFFIFNFIYCCLWTPLL